MTYFLFSIFWSSTVLQIEGSLVWFQMVPLEFFIGIILPIALWSWGRLSLWEKWVPGVFSGGKNGRCVRLTTLPPSCAIVAKSGNLNILELSGNLGPVMELMFCSHQLFRHRRLASQWNSPPGNSIANSRNFSWMGGSGFYSVLISTSNARIQEEYTD